jgi:hypothetical protein
LHLVVTHFHTDHYRGIDRLHDYYREATLSVTQAVQAPEFLKLHNDNEEPSFLGGLPGTIALAKQRRVAGDNPAFRQLGVGSTIIRRDHIEVRSLSPTQAALQASVGELAQALSTRQREAVQTFLQDENRSSVAIHIEAYGVTVLLGADLVASPRQFGWQAVIDDPLHQSLAQAQLVKVPHHGSVGAHHQDAWDRLVESGATMLVAPYWSSGLPCEEDCQRLLSLGGDLWQAAPSVGFVEESGHKISIPRSTGRLQARRRTDEESWRVESHPPAFRVEPSS